MTLEEAIKARHSVRAYKAQPLAEEIVKVQEKKTFFGKIRESSFRHDTL